MGWPPGSEMSERVHSRIDQILECASPPTKLPGATAGGAVAPGSGGADFSPPLFFYDREKIPQAPLRVFDSPLAWMYRSCE